MQIAQHADDYAFAVAEAALVDFLMYCCEHHGYNARNLMTNKKMLPRVLVLLQSRHAFLKLSSLLLLCCYRQSLERKCMRCSCVALVPTRHRLEGGRQRLFPQVYRAARALYAGC